MRLGAAMVVLLHLPASQAQTGPALERVLSTHVLRVCTTGDYRPFSFRKSDDTYEGMDIDAVHELADTLGAKVQIVATSWPTLMADFVSGKCDLAAGGISVSLERQKLAGYSEPYLIDAKAALVRCSEAARYPTLEAIDQNSVRVIENPGGTNERFARSHLKTAHLQVHTDNLSIFTELIEGRADVMITDTSETLMQHKIHPELCSVQQEPPLQYGEKAYLLPRGDVAFKDYVDQWLHLYRASGQLHHLQDKWLN